MKFSKITLVIVFFLSFDLFSYDIKQEDLQNQSIIQIIELHHLDEGKEEQNITPKRSCIPLF